MKNQQSGFIGILLAIIAVIGIGAVTYYSHEKSVNSAPTTDYSSHSIRTTPTTPQPSTNAGLKTYSDSDVSFQYDGNATISKTTNPLGGVIVSKGNHSETLFYIEHMGMAFDASADESNKSLGSQKFGDATFDIYQTGSGKKLYQWVHRFDAITIDTDSTGVSLINLSTIQIKAVQPQDR